MNDRRLAINAARRELHDEFELLEELIGVTRCARHKRIVLRALIAAEEKGCTARETEKEAGRMLAYDSVELERRYTW